MFPLGSIALRFMLESSRVIQMNKKWMPLAFCGLLMLGGCQSRPKEPELTRYSNMALDAGFDTVMTLTGYTETEDQFNQYFAEMKQLFLHYNALFDVYNDYAGLNNIKTINDNAGIAPVSVDPEIIELLNTARQFYDLSEGEFDVTMGAVLKIWHTYRDEGIAQNNAGQLGQVPSVEQLQKAQACTGWDKVEINEADSTVYLNQSCASLDVGGIAKGFAAGKVQQRLIEAGLVHGTVDAGGNICTINNKPGNQDWRVGIRNPSGNGSLAIVELPGSAAFVSSGDYERFYAAEDGSVYHHIIDPQTLFPATYYHQVTIITENSGFADALSTALFTMSYQDGLALIERFRNTYPDQPIEDMWVMDPDQVPSGVTSTAAGEYAVIMTDSMKNYLAQ